MFCKNCGAEMNEDARFCLKCGNDRLEGKVQKKEIIEDNNVKFQLKPKYNILFQLVINLEIGLIYGILISLFFVRAKTNIEILIIIIFAILYTFVKMPLNKMQYNKVKYNFYNTKIECVDSFLNVAKKELKYKYVREVTMSQGILERICGIGTIRIYTNASTNVLNGINIPCVENLQQNYKKIKNIIDEGTQEN